MPEYHIGVNTMPNIHGRETMEHGHGLLPHQVSDFAGATVLALGAGIQRWEELYFGQLPDLGVNVISLDPVYAHLNGWREQPVEGSRLGNMVAGIGQAIPLRNESVDVIFSTWSTPLVFFEESISNISARLHIEHVAREMYRILRPGGLISLQPVEEYLMYHDVQKAERKTAVEAFSESGFECNLEQFLIKVRKSQYLVSRLIGNKIS